VNPKPKTTRARTAAQEAARKKEFDADHIQAKKNRGPGVNMGKVRVEKGDSGGFEI
jgi:hypothetical protein